MYQTSVIFSYCNFIIKVCENSKTTTWMETTYMWSNPKLSAASTKPLSEFTSKPYSIFHVVGPCKAIDVTYQQNGTREEKTIKERRDGVGPAIHWGWDSVKLRKFQFPDQYNQLFHQRMQNKPCHHLWD